MDIKFKVEGLRELDDALIALAQEYGHKNAATAMRPAMKAAMKPMEEAIRSTTPVDSGTLAASTKTRIGKVTRKMLNSVHFHKDMVIAARTGWTWGKPSLWNQALAVEFGTSKHSGSATLWSAFQSQIDGAVRIFGKELGPAIERTAARLAKKGRK